MQCARRNPSGAGGRPFGDHLHRRLRGDIQGDGQHVGRARLPGDLHRASDRHVGQGAASGQGRGHAGPNRGDSHLVPDGGKPRRDSPHPFGALRAGSNLPPRWEGTFETGSSWKGKENSGGQAPSTPANPDTSGSGFPTTLDGTLRGFRPLGISWSRAPFERPYCSGRQPAVR